MRYDLPDPAVYRAKVVRKNIYYYSNGPNEQEFICWPSSYRRIRIRGEEMRQFFKAYEASKKKENEKLR